MMKHNGQYCNVEISESLFLKGLTNVSFLIAVIPKKTLQYLLHDYNDSYLLRAFHRHVSLYLLFILNLITIGTETVVLFYLVKLKIFKLEVTISKYLVILSDNSVINKGKCSFT